MGSCGLIVAISQMSSGTGAGIFSGICMLVVGIGFALCALGDFYCLVTVSILLEPTLKVIKTSAILLKEFFCTVTFPCKIIIIIISLKRRLNSLLFKAF